MAAIIGWCSALRSPHGSGAPTPPILCCAVSTGTCIAARIVHVWKRPSWPWLPFPLVVRGRKSLVMPHPYHRFASDCATPVRRSRRVAARFLRPLLRPVVGPIRAVSIVVLAGCAWGCWLAARGWYGSVACQPV